MPFLVRERFMRHKVQIHCISVLVKHIKYNLAATYLYNQQISNIGYNF
jgi:hypothetical protein